MTHNLKPYPAYKDSGVPWLGEVPEHWETRKLRNILTGISERNRPDLPLLSVVREKGVILRDVTNKDENHNYIPDDLTNYKVVWHGQFAMNKMKAWQGSFGVSQHEGIVSPAYFIFDVQNVDGGYFHKAIRSKVYVPFFTQASDGVRIGQWDLSQVRMKEIPFFVPPSDEQAAIVRYLDYMDRRIRRFIRAKQTLIKLLEEQKQSIIQQAVTGQIDVLTGQPYPAYKPSGVEWLGEVPEHWDVMPLRRVTITRCDGPFGSGLKSAHYTSHGIRVVRLQNIGHAEFKNADDAYISPSHYATLGDHTVEPGDLLIAGLGDERHPAGRACVAPAFISPAMVKADCFRFRLYTRHLNPEFAALHLTATAVDASAILSTGATRQRINLQSTAARSIVIPPPNEQVAIIEQLSTETSSLHLAITRTEKEIDLLREYHTRLIADVVTGKLDVRQAAAGLPEEVEEPELLEDEADIDADASADDLEEEIEEEAA